MAPIDSANFPPVIAVTVIVLYAISLLNFMKRKLPALQSLVSGEAIRNEQHVKISSNDAFSLRSSDLRVEKESRFSADWWCHEQVFQLEKRAIFSKSWIYATHRCLFAKPGDYVTLEIVGFSFFLILGKDDVLRAFHNVCRHRAYEVTRKDRGSSTILGCRYHGWSYDTKGQLTKAPQFDALPGFDKTQNGLWEIHVKVTVEGLVLINLDAAKTVPDLTLELNLDTKLWNILQSERVAEWHYENAFNWKIATSSLRNCDFAPTFGISKHDHWLWMLLGSILKQTRQSHRRIDLLTTLSIYPIKDIWVATKIVPVSVSRTTVRFEVYARSPRNFSSLDATIKRLKEITFAEMDRLEIVQKQLVDGSAFLDHENLAHQMTINAFLLAHRKMERSEGGEIQPAARQIHLSGKGEEDVELCKVLGKPLVNDGLCPGESSSFGLDQSLNW